MSEPAAKVLLDSVTRAGDRITTVEVTHHRFILAEVNTHRALSRNSASSRAIPVDKMLEKFVNDPAYPAVYRSEQPGMQGGKDLKPKDAETAKHVFYSWNFDTAKTILDYIQAMKDTYGEKEDANGTPEWKKHVLHKSWLNRLMEPMQWHTAIWTFDHNLLMNFLNQRLHEDAQPEFYEVMKVLKPALDESEPQLLDNDEWHTPLIQPDEMEMPIARRRKISVARCARVSYLTHDGVRDIAKDIDLHDKLISQDPPHASPFEHVCTPAPWNKQTVAVPRLGDAGALRWYHTPKIGNLYGWLQMRHAVGMP